MTLPNETIATGACPRCPRCGVIGRLDIYRSRACYCIGASCRCGPYTRESGYYPTQREARRALAHGRYGR